jgi:hypothetical protein
VGGTWRAFRALTDTASRGGLVFRWHRCRRHAPNGAASRNGPCFAGTADNGGEIYAMITVTQINIYVYLANKSRLLLERPSAACQKSAGRLAQCSERRSSACFIPRVRECVPIYGGCLASFPASPEVYEICMLKFERIAPLGGWFWQTGSRLWRETERYMSTWSLRCPFAGSGSGATTRPTWSPPGEAAGAVLLMPTRPRPDKRMLSPSECWESVGGAFATRPGQPS